MSHWIIAPVVLPALLAPLIAFVMRYDMPLARTASLAGTVALLAIAIGLTVTAAGGETHIYRLGDWPAPFGIVSVLDRLSAMMVLADRARWRCRAGLCHRHRLGRARAAFPRAVSSSSSWGSTAPS
jgi:formate hydrogenlyase subunit 3/multisubunit Na+/H+ antiporter MnhD subunit